MSEGRTCANCGGPMLSNAVTGYCSRSPACRKLAKAAANAERRSRPPVEPGRCRNCGKELRRNNTYSLCHTTPECKAMYYMEKRLRERAKDGRIAQPKRPPQQLAKAYEMRQTSMSDEDFADLVEQIKALVALAGHPLPVRVLAEATQAHLGVVSKAAREAGVCHSLEETRCGG